MGGILAVIDKIIQHNTPGRSGQMRDVFIDILGVFVGSILVILFWFLSSRCKKQKHN